MYLTGFMGPTTAGDASRETDWNTSRKPRPELGELLVEYPANLPRLIHLRPLAGPLVGTQGSRWDFGPPLIEL